MISDDSRKPLPSNHQRVFVVARLPRAHVLRVYARGYKARTRFPIASSMLIIRFRWLCACTLNCARCFLVLRVRARVWYDIKQPNRTKNPQKNWSKSQNNACKTVDKIYLVVISYLHIRKEVCTMFDYLETELNDNDLDALEAIAEFEEVN